MYTSYKETEHCENGSAKLEVLFPFAFYFHIIHNSISLQIYVTCNVSFMFVCRYVCTYI